MPVMIHTGVDADLDMIESHPETGDHAVLLDALLQELDDQFNGTFSLAHTPQNFLRPQCSIVRLETLYRLGYQVFRLKPLPSYGPLGGYRIIYAQDLDDLTSFYVLAIAKKFYLNNKPDSDHEYYDYSETHRITQVVLERYNDVGLPKRSG